MIVVIAGPNGSGKSTIAPSLVRDFLGIHEYVNADAIAVGLSAFNTASVAIEAGRIMLQRMNELIHRRQSFAFETTLASRTFAKSIESWRDRGYEVHLFFMSLPSPEIAYARVWTRVQSGGHDIPTVVIQRRFKRGLENLFKLYLPIVDSWRIYDSSSEFPELVAHGDITGHESILNRPRWDQLRREKDT